jgi:hypothetical protein
MRYEGKYVRTMKLRKVSAFEKARMFYMQFAGLHFEDDVLEYLKMGWVYSSPTSFAMACVINIAPENAEYIEPAWFIRTVIGDLMEALNGLWMQHRLEYVVWCRNNEEGGTRLRKYKMKRMFALARKLKLRAGSAEAYSRDVARKAGSTPARAIAVMGYGGI